MQKRTLKLLLFTLVLIAVAINYSWMNSYVVKELGDEFSTKQENVLVTRIVDGDTIDTAPIGRVRLLGINTPEKGEEYYAEATNFLKKEILNKTVTLEFGKERKDRYNRTLAYVFLGNSNINLEIVKEGFANYYFPSEKDRYYNEFNTAWEECLKKDIRYCKKSNSPCFGCLELEKLDYQNQEVVIKNNCEFECELTGWSIKDEGRKKFIMPRYKLGSSKEVRIIVGNKSDQGNMLFWKGEQYVWTKTGDSIFVRDSNGKLVIFDSY